MTFPSPFTDPDFYQRVRIGGLLISDADLVEIDGLKIEDEWNEQKPTGSSGATQVFKGTKPPGPVKLTFEAIDEAGFQELRQVWDLLAPKPNSGGNGSGSSVGSPGSAASKQAQPTPAQIQADLAATNAQVLASVAKSDPTPQNQLAAVQAQLAAVNAGGGIGAVGITSTAGVTSAPAAQPNPGPRPPTLSVKNGYLNYLGINAVSRKSWDGPKPTATNSYRVIIEVVAQREPVQAAVGAASPKAADPIVGTGGNVKAADPASSAKDANTAAAQAGAQ